MLSRAALYAFVAFFAVNTTSIADDKTEVPTWKKASPGTSAFLGDDGGGVNTLTVCDTADHFRDWLEYEHPAGCQPFQAGLRATIEVVVFDPVRDALRTSSEIISKPLVKIHIPARKFIGYVQLLGLHPVVPPGTIIYGKPSHNEDTSTFKLYPTATETDDDKALDLGREFSAKVIKYSPTSDDRWELQITITDGKFSGKSGWISSFLLEDSQGEMLDQFSKAVAYDKIH